MKHKCVHIYMFVCVCVQEDKREKNLDKQKTSLKLMFLLVRKDPTV